MDDDSSSGISTYQNGLGIDNKLKVSNSTSASYFLADHLGSTNALTDATGSITASNSYDSFGNGTNTSFSTRYQFTGREFDSFTGLQFNRARWYDPAIGRFISEDPIGFRGGLNLFEYVKDRPLTFVDPLGLAGEDTNQPALWRKPNIEPETREFQNPQNLNPVTANSNVDFATATLWDRVKMAWGDLPLGRTWELVSGTPVPGRGYACESKAGVPALGEAVTTLEMGPDLYNTVDTINRRNHDINDVINCTQGRGCQISPYDSGLGSRATPPRYDDLTWWEKVKCKFWGTCPAH